MSALSSDQLAGRGTIEGAGLYRAMLLIRTVQQRILVAYRDGLGNGPCHLADGQEAVAVGAASVLRPGDASIGTYRGHGHVLARGAPVAGVIAEVFGRADGLCGGKGGSMHLTSVAHGYYGSYAIVGAQLPIACGLAWAARIRKSDQVTVCFLGDGATNIGAFHEALNLAAIWKLPVVFVCENNQYMEYTPIADVTAVARPAADRAAAYGLERLVVDGNDVEAVAALVGQCVRRARSGDGPSLVEADTYRLGGHSAADLAQYRPEEEVRRWRALDPIPRYRAVLAGRGAAEDELAEVEASVRDEVDRAMARATAAPPPPDEEAWTDVWAAGGSTWRN